MYIYTCKNCFHSMVSEDITCTRTRCPGCKSVEFGLRKQIRIPLACRVDRRGFEIVDANHIEMVQKYLLST